MIEKKGWLKNAEARLDGFYINGKKEKGQRLTQEEVDAWNGVAKKKAAPKKAKKVEETVEEEVVVEETTDEE
jgi:hypothetical protein